MIVLFDSNYREIGSVDMDIDIEIGTSQDARNDFEFSTSLLDFVPYGFYIDGTEYGGIIEYNYSTTEVDYHTVKGFTWRGLMSKSLIVPPSGSDYKVVSGEANEILRTMLSSVLGGFFEVPEVSSGLTINNYQFPLYINTLDGLEGMLEKYGYRLKIWASKPNHGQPVKVYVEAVQSTQIQGAYNSDNRVPMTFTIDNMGINHLLCAGSGELQNRMKVDLYVNQNGQITQTQYYTGFDERTEFYDYGSAESMQDLIDGGTEKLKEVMSYKSLKIKAPQDLELEVGDMVTGTFPDGTVITAPIVQKIYAIVGGINIVEYKIKGEEL